MAFGWNPHVAAFALELLDWASSVTLVTDGRRFEGDWTDPEAFSAALQDAARAKAYH